jgi:glycosyltransferase involved in cell wall biosynthesis
MRIVLVADTFPPMRTSGAVQLRDLTREWVHQGHDLTVLLPSPEQTEAWVLDEVEGARVLRLKAPKVKDVGYFRRTLAELYMPFAMYLNFRKSPHSRERWDGVVWYSPSIFHGPLVRALKNSSGCKSYLILRDIFPEWARDLGLVSNGLVYWCLNQVARFQYSVADTIGVQSAANLVFLEWWGRRPGKTLQVLENWLGESEETPCPIRLESQLGPDCKALVYAGNMGIAQGMDTLLGVAAAFAHRPDVAFVLVGRGSEASRLREAAASRDLANVFFHEEIDPDAIPDLYRQCVGGIVLLDPRHRTHNTPGKFLTYMQNGLPVIAAVNRGNDLMDVIGDARVGQVCEAGDLAAFIEAAEVFLREYEVDSERPARCRRLFEDRYTARQAAGQIVSALLADRAQS